jgi:hypothetical protein
VSNKQVAPHKNKKNGTISYQEEILHWYASSGTTVTHSSQVNLATMSALMANKFLKICHIFSELISKLGKILRTYLSTLRHKNSLNLKLNDSMLALCDLTAQFISLRSHDYLN